MSDTVITVENLCKKYTIGHQKQARYVTFRDNLNHLGRGMLQRLRHPLSANKENVDLEEFWALKDVNFEIKRGDRVGIIGRNGAGKSTLLKILSRITEPTSGRVTIKGRVASLLEVGTGFHPELTGRENVFLNGAILGMSRGEIKNKFDEIVDFAEIEKFLDTPVKRYSSGMYVRLAFAVAAHLEPEILLVDEVLAVGDAEFQKKCLGKMKAVGREGRTVIFISHNMHAIRKLCQKAMLLKAGEIELISSVENTLSTYRKMLTVVETDVFKQIMSLTDDDDFELHSICLTQDNIKCDTFSNNKSITINIDYSIKSSLLGFHVYFQLCDFDDTILIESLNDGQYKNIKKWNPGKYISVATIPENFLNDGYYYIKIFAGIHKIRRCFQKPIKIKIEVYKEGIVNRAYPEYKSPGKLLPYIHWSNNPY